MAQFNKDTQTYIDGRRILHDVGMISNKNGDIVTTDNRFPVDAQITGSAVGLNKPFYLEVAQGLIARIQFQSQVWCSAKYGQWCYWFYLGHR